MWREKGLAIGELWKGTAIPYYCCRLIVEGIEARSPMLGATSIDHR